MSRSYRKHPVLTDPSTNHRYRPRPKTLANKRVRSRLRQELQRQAGRYEFDTLVSTNHALYKRYYPSWDIIDYRTDLRCYTPKELAAFPDDLIRAYYQK